MQYIYIYMVIILFIENINDNDYVYLLSNRVNSNYARHNHTVARYRTIRFHYLLKVRVVSLIISHRRALV